MLRSEVRGIDMAGVSVLLCLLLCPRSERVRERERRRSEVGVGVGARGSSVSALLPAPPRHQQQSLVPAHA